MRNTQRLFAIAGIVSLLVAGCGKGGGVSGDVVSDEKPAKPLTAPPEVTAEEEDGFHDLIFYIQDEKQLPDGSQSVHGVGTYKGRQLGLEVVLSPTWKGASADKNLPLTIYSGTLSYHSTGSDSDAFVQVLDELYGTKLSPKTMAKETQFAGMALEGNPGDLSKGPVKIKTFFDDGNEKDYAEIFTDVDLGAHRLEVHEKDEDYRAAVVKALEAH